MTNKKWNEIKKLTDDATYHIENVDQLADNKFQASVFLALDAINKAVLELVGEQFDHTYDGHGGTNG